MCAGKGKGYNVSHNIYASSFATNTASQQIFAGKDASKGLGKSSLKPEDAIADYSSLDEKEKGVLDVRCTFQGCSRC